MRGPGVKPDDAWTPIIQHSMLPGPSAAALFALGPKLLIVFLISLAPMILTLLMSMSGVRFNSLSTFALAFYVIAFMLMMSSSALALSKSRREYRHGYTTADSIGKYGYYYGTVPQLETSTGIEIRAAGQTRLDPQTLLERTALARTHGTTPPPRMSPAEKASAATTAAAINEVRLREAKTRTQRAVLVRTMGPEAGSARAKGLGLALAALLTAAGLAPISLILGAVASSLTGNLFWFLPLAAILAAVTILLCLSRKFTTKSARLTEKRLGLAPNSLPKWPLMRPIKLPPTTS